MTCMAKTLDSLSHEELLDLVTRLEKKRKYGIVWDEEVVSEQVVLDCKNSLPVLKNLKIKGYKSDHSGVQHSLIKGDNFHSLSVLSFTHIGKIDLIYIDPPYNTGNKEDEEGFVYNDDRVNEEDTYRHSKWLSFMSKRLELAYGLLNDSGLCFISIDEHEFAQLRLLCDSIFGESNFLNFLVWKKRSTGGQAKDGSLIAQTEFILIYAKNKSLAKLNKIDNPNEGAEKWRDFRKSGGQWQRVHRRNQFYPFYFDPESELLTLKRENKNQVEIFPTDKDGEEGFWENGLETAKFRLENGELKVSTHTRGSQRGNYKILNLEVADDVQNAGNFLNIPSTRGSSEIKSLGLKFNNAKPLDLIEFILKIGGNKNSLVLDFFAGSGSTGHAVMRLNSSDGGRRSAILCTNNEINSSAPNGVCTDVTIPRLLKAANGFMSPSGVEFSALGGDWNFFETDFVKVKKNKDQMKIDLTEKCAGILCLKESVFESVDSTEDWKLFSDGKKHVGMYFSVDSRQLNELQLVMNPLKGKKVLYVFTLDPSGLEAIEFQNWQGVEIRDIPQKILDTYRRIFKI